MALFLINVEIAALQFCSFAMKFIVISPGVVVAVDVATAVSVV